MWLRGECLNAEAAGAACLAPVATLIIPIVKFGTWILNYHYNYFIYELGLAAFGVLIVILTLLFRRSVSWWGTFYIIALVLTGVGEFYALKRQQDLVLYCDLAAALVALIGFALMRVKSPEIISQGWLETKRGVARVRVLEVVAVITILAATVVSRFYDLNRNPSGWDAEACPHRIIAASWQEILKQEIGQAVQQSSGLSWTALHKLFTRVDHHNLFYLDERLLGVGISLLCSLAMFFFVRSIRGPFAGVLALVLYSFGPLDLGWSRLPVMHHIPVLLGILMAWATFKALSSRSWISFLSLAALIFLSKFVYPSGKLIWFGPVAAFFSVLIFERKAWRGHLPKLTLLLVGLALFLTARSGVYWLVQGDFKLMPPFENPYQSGLVVSQLERAKQLFSEGLLFFYELFYFPASMTHWTIHTTFMPARSISSFCVVFLILAFSRLLFLFKKPEALVFMGMIVGGLIPGMATGLADRRIAVSLVLCLVLAVLEFSWFIDTFVGKASKAVAQTLKYVVLLTVTACLVIVQTQTFFSGPVGRPSQVEAGDSVRQYVKESTVIVYLADEGRCEMFYSLYDIMKQSGGTIAFANADDSALRAKDQIEHPTPIVDYWFYTLSELAPQIEKIRQTRYWQRYLFVFQPTPERNEWIALIKAKYPNGKERRFEYDKALGRKLFMYEVENPAPSLP